MKIQILRMTNIAKSIYNEWGASNMLVLGRKPGEYVMIGDDIKIKVIKSEDGNLRLAIDAPKDLSIVRGELSEQQAFETSEKHLKK